MSYLPNLAELAAKDLDRIVHLAVLQNANIAPPKLPYTSSASLDVWRHGMGPNVECLLGYEVFKEDYRASVDEVVKNVCCFAVEPCVLQVNFRTVNGCGFWGYHAWRLYKLKEQ